MEISSRYHKFIYLLWVGGLLLIVGGFLFFFAWVITGGRLFDTPEPGLVQLTHYNAFSEYPAWSPDGLSILFQSTFEDPEDAVDKLYSIGLHDRLVRRVETHQIEPYQATWSPDGNYIAFSNWRNVCLVRADGDSTPSCVSVQNAQWLSWSPDGEEIVFDADGTIYLLAVMGGKPILQPEPIQPGMAAAWSPDGACIAYSRGDGVWIMQADGSHLVQLRGTGARTYPFGWSPDGQFLLVNKYPSSGASNFYAIRLSDGKKIRLTNNHEYHTAPRLSPDGKQIAFHSLRESKIDDSVAYNVYVMDVPDLPSPKTPVNLGNCMPPIARAKATAEPTASSEPGRRSAPGGLDKLIGPSVLDIILGGVIVILVVLGLLAGAYNLVRAIGTLHFQRFRMETEADFRNMAYHQKLQALVAALETLGFMPFGVLSEKTFHGTEAKSLSLGSAHAKAFASIALIKGRAVYFYYTPFTDGSVLLTANGAFRPTNKKGYFVQTVPSGSPSTLLAAHQERQRFFMAQGLVPFSEYTPASRLEATRLFYANHSLRNVVRLSFMRSCSAIFLAFLIPIVAIGAYLAIRNGYFLSDVARLGWKTYHSSEGGFSIAMPHTPREVREGNLHQFVDDDGEFTYSVTYIEYEAGDIQRLGIDKALEECQNQVIPESGKLVFERDFSLDDHPGREFRATESDSSLPYLVEGRVVLVDRRVYRVLVRYRLPSTLSEKIQVFLDSFKLTD